jgi:hypothetical protein
MLRKKINGFLVYWSNIEYVACVAYSSLFNIYIYMYIYIYICEVVLLLINNHPGPDFLD